MLDLVTRRLRRLCSALLSSVILLPALASAGSYQEFFNAVRHDQWYQIQQLLQRGFDPNTIDPERGETGLMLSLREDHLRAAEVLLKAPGLDVEIKARNGDTALMIAAISNNKPAVEALLAQDAEVNRPGWTPLHYAASSGADAIVQLLLDNYAYIDAESPNKTTPLMMAARGGQTSTVLLLVEAGADPTLKNELGFSALDLAKKFDHAGTADRLQEWLLRHPMAPRSPSQ